MSDQDTDFDLPTDESGPKQLREALKAANAAKAEAEQRATEAQAALEATQRQAAFTNAGIDLNSPQGKFFADHYDGPLEDIATKAAELGIGQPAAPTIPAAEQQAWQQTAQAVQGATPAGNPDLDDELKFGMSPQQIAAIRARQGGLVGSYVDNT